MVINQAKNYEKVAQLLGWSKKSRHPRQTKNGGRPPDTTDALLGRPKKFEGPRRSVNVDQNPVTTYKGFVPSNTEGCWKQCWLNAMTECLYAPYTEIWYSSSSGKSVYIYSYNLMTFLFVKVYQETGSGRKEFVLFLVMVKTPSTVLFKTTAPWASDHTNVLLPINTSMGSLKLELDHRPQHLTRWHRSSL